MAGFGARALWGIQLHFEAAVALTLQKGPVRCSALGSGEGSRRCSDGARLLMLWRGKGRPAGPGRAGPAITGSCRPTVSGLSRQ